MGKLFEKDSVVTRWSAPIVCRNTEHSSLRLSCSFLGPKNSLVRERSGQARLQGGSIPPHPQPFVLSSLWDLSSQTKGRTWALVTDSTES